MTFDPLGDFEAEGYLRNYAKEKDLGIVRRLEHSAFTTGLDEAFGELAKAKHPAYGDVLNTHRILFDAAYPWLFDAVYPWAGQDRTQTAPEIAVSKGCRQASGGPSSVNSADTVSCSAGSRPSAMSQTRT